MVGNRLQEGDSVIKAQDRQLHYLGHIPLTSLQEASLLTEHRSHRP